MKRLQDHVTSLSLVRKCYSMSDVDLIVILESDF